MEEKEIAQEEEKPVVEKVDKTPKPQKEILAVSNQQKSTSRFANRTIESIKDEIEVLKKKSSNQKAIKFVR